MNYFSTEWRFQRVLIRARFDENNAVVEPAKRSALLLEGCKEIWEKRHPTPFECEFCAFIGRQGK